MTLASEARNPLPPIAPRRPHSFTTHGITVIDDYAWLKDARWQEVLRDPSILDPDIRKYLEAENDYTESLLGHTARLQKKLVAEMRGRIKEDDSSVPSPDGPFAYLRKFREGGQHEMFGRTPRDGGDDQESCSTATRLPRTTNISSSAAAGIRRTTSCRPGAPTPKGSEYFSIRVRDWTTAPTSTTSSRRPTAAWSGALDANSFFYVKARRQPPADAGLAASARHASRPTMIADL